jgi:hypothetical protein
MKIPKHVIMVSVVSKNLREAGYDKQTGNLWIIFHQGRTYYYDDVPFSKYHTLINLHEDVGEYFAEHIDGKYTHHEI